MIDRLVIDVSHHQGDIDWRKVAAAGVNGVIVKASDGATWKDPKFVRNVVGATTAGLKVGSYHFLRPGSKPVDQARNFLAQMHLVGGVGAFSLLPWVDVEDPDDDRGSWGTLAKEDRQQRLGAFLQEIDAELASKGKQGLLARCGIYCPPSWFTNEFPGDRSGRLLWAARPGQIEPDLRDTCWQKAGWAIWQYSWKGKVDGISTDVDLNKLRNPLL